MTDTFDSLSHQPSSINKSRKSADKNWLLLRNVLRASHSLRAEAVEVVEDFETFFADLLNSTPSSSQKTISISGLAIEDYKITALMFHCIRRSTQKDIEVLKELISNHPGKYVRNSRDPNSFINRKDLNGIRPVYEAARNGYAETVMLLIENGANPKLESNGEDCLQVACRWGHTVVAKCLMAAENWDNKQIKKAISVTRNPELAKYLKDKICKTYAWCGCE
jgi:hypothetical protein